MSVERADYSTEDEYRQALALEEDTTTKTLDELVAEGWTPANAPPDTNRIVQIAYADGSTGPDCKGFYDEIDQDPPTGVRLWWDIHTCPHLYPHVMSWRDFLPAGFVRTVISGTRKHLVVDSES